MIRNCETVFAFGGRAAMTDEEIASFLSAVRNSEGCKNVKFASRGVWLDAVSRRPEMAQAVAAKGLKVIFQREPTADRGGK